MEEEDFSAGSVSGRVSVPRGQVVGAAVVLHPHPSLGGTMNDHVVVALCHALTAAGVRAFRFDFGSGLRPAQGARDVEAVARLAEAESGRVVIVGYSWGSVVGGAAWARLGGKQFGYAGVSFPAGFTTVMLLGAFQAEFEAHAARVTECVALVCGDADQFCSLERFKELVGRTGAESVVVGREGHFWQAQARRREMCDFVVAFARRFLSNVI